MFKKLWEDLRYKLKLSEAESSGSKEKSHKNIDLGERLPDHNETSISEAANAVVFKAMTTIKKKITKAANDALDESLKEIFKAIYKIIFFGTVIYVFFGDKIIIVISR